MAQQIAGGRGQGSLACFANIAKALSQSFILNFCVNIGVGARHGAAANRFAARCLHRVVDVAGHLPLGDIAVECAGVVELVAQRQSVSGAASQTHLLRSHPPADLRQPNGVVGRAWRIHGIGHRQLSVIGHNLGRFGQCLFERIGRIVVILHQCDPLGARCIRVLTTCSSIRPILAILRQSSAGRIRRPFGVPAHRICLGNSGGKHSQCCGKFQHFAPRR